MCLILKCIVLQMWHQKGFVLLALLASVSHGFRFQNEKETSEGHTKVIETSEDVQIGEDSKTRDQRKIEPLVEDVDREAVIEETKENPIDEEEQQEEIQARFFLKDKLCALGLADVSFQNITYSMYK